MMSSRKSENDVIDYNNALTFASNKIRATIDSLFGLTIHSSSNVIIHEMAL